MAQPASSDGGEQDGPGEAERLQDYSGVVHFASQRNPSFHARTVANTSVAVGSGRPAWRSAASRTELVRERRKGLMRRSRPSVDGSVTSSRSRSGRSRPAPRGRRGCRVRRRGEPEVRERVFMAAVHPRCVGQICDAVEGIEHLCRRAFEQAAAAGAEQRVAAEQGAVTHVGDVAERMSGNRHHGEFEPEVSKVCRRLRRRAPAPRRAFFRGPVR